MSQETMAPNKHIKYDSDILSLLSPTTTHSRASSIFSSRTISSLFMSETVLTNNSVASCRTPNLSIASYGPNVLISNESNLSLNTAPDSDTNKSTDTDAICVNHERRSTDVDLTNHIVDTEALYLAKYGYKRRRKIAPALQGSVYELYSVKDGETYVVKQADKRLHSKGIIFKNGKKYKVKENIRTETAILQFITKYCSSPYSITFIDFFESEKFYYLVMSDGGFSMFDFVLEAHEYIQSGKLSIKQWRKSVKYIFWQMVVMLLWLHNTANVCHLDVSLENMLVKNKRFIRHKGKLSISTDIRIQFCDYGVAEFYDIDIDGSNLNNGYLSNKYCGKPNYNSPQVYRNNMFDGRKADVWSLGVVIFCIAVGCPPYKKPCKEDKIYKNYIEKGHLAQLLHLWKKHRYVTEHMLFLMKWMLKQDETERYLMDDVIQHKWLRVYYKKYYDLVKNDLLTAIYEK